MKKRPFVLVLFAAALMSLGAAVGGLVDVPGLARAQGGRAATKEAARAFDVRVIFSGSREGLADEASRLGAQGWELVSVVIDESNGRAYVGYLKRAR